MAGVKKVKPPTAKDMGLPYAAMKVTIQTRDLAYAIGDLVTSKFRKQTQNETMELMDKLSPLTEGYSPYVMIRALIAMTGVEMEDMLKDWMAEEIKNGNH